ncbi:MAG: DUF3365 domain-containing protein [Bacteroidia bacterium]|nr:DUF3365 domain-containing protein [Bacteroidia bacterium]
MKRPFFITLYMMILILTLERCKNEQKDTHNTSASSPFTDVASEIKLSKNDSLFFVQEGTLTAKQLYAGILARLNKALDEQGPYESVKYCNHYALHITDSLAKTFGIKAKRTSLKLRNPKNAPDSLEKTILEMYQQTMSKNPIIISTKDSVKFFTPIYIAPICLHCHGIPNKDIPDVTLIALNQLYPNDQAKNYELYDIRGIWSITFPKNYQSKFHTIHNLKN